MKSLYLPISCEKDWDFKLNFSCFKLLFLSLFFSQLFSQDLQLDTTYLINKDVILSTDIIKDAPAFEILRFNNRLAVQKRAADIEKLFLAHDTQVMATSATIEFIKTDPTIFNEAINILTDAFLQKYPEMQIKRLQVFPVSNASGKFVRLDIKPHVLNSSVGQVVSYFKKNNKILRGLIGFSLNAEILKLTPTQNINRAELITADNSAWEFMPFKRASHKKIDPKNIGFYKALRNLEINKPIPYTAIRIVPAVKRGDKVRVSINSGTVKINFIGTAGANGAIGSVISIKRKGARDIDAIITARGQATVE